MKEIFLLNRKIDNIETINIIGNKKSNCLNSSYKFALIKIRETIIDKIDKMSVPTIIECNLFSKIFFSTNGNIAKPNNIINGNLNSNHIGMYDEGNSCAFIHSPRVKVQTVCI